MISVFAGTLASSGFRVTPDGIKKIPSSSSSTIKQSQTTRDIINARHYGASIGFTAPEVFVADDSVFFKHRNSFAGDIYAGGMCVLCCLVKASTYLLNNNNCYQSRYVEMCELKVQVTETAMLSRIEKVWSATELQRIKELRLMDLVFCCLSLDPANRPTAGDVLAMLGNAQTK
jgi:serine/threonine protein kinase